MDAVFPLECLACGSEGTHVCGSCLLNLPTRPFEPAVVRPLASAVGAFAYASPLVRVLIGDVKYRGYFAAVPALMVLARRGAAACAGRFVAPEAIVPVPLHARRLRARGFNQAETVARALAETWQIPLFKDAAVRVRETSPQAEPGTDRLRNVRSAFHAEPLRVRGRRIVLVDDVWTSGATMRECADALLEAGAAEVRGFALAWGSGKRKDREGSPVSRSFHQDLG